MWAKVEEEGKEEMMIEWQGPMQRVRYMCEGLRGIKSY